MMRSGPWTCPCLPAALAQVVDTALDPPHEIVRLGEPAVAEGGRYAAQARSVVVLEAQ